MHIGDFFVAGKLEQLRALTWCDSFWPGFRSCRLRMTRDVQRSVMSRRRMRGAVSLEYVVLLATCGLVISLALVSLGPAIATAYQQNRQIVIAPVP